MSLNDNNNKKKPNQNDNRRRNITGIVTLVIWALILTIFGNYVLSRTETTGSVEIYFSELINLVESDQVEEVMLESGKYTVTLTEEGEAAWLEEYYAEQGYTSVPEGAEMPTLYTTPLSYTDFLLLLQEHGVAYYSPYQQSSVLSEILISYVLPMAIMLLVMVLFYRFAMSDRMGGGGIGNVGKSNAKVYVEKSTGVTFRDVAGQDEAKESLEEIIDFLHNPGKYTAIGARLPKGALLVGAPGTGKTLLAKAVAGEANVPFFSISGSDFVEMFVGVGASRVRDLFKEAAKMAPCIIFIDEIDTIGKSRDGGRLGGNDEREQTLNQLLAELDGFDPTKGVIVLGATNRPEVLDKALLRPGRFDRRITVDRPNLAGRLATLQVHTRKIRLADDVDLNKIAQATAGAVGADLANLVNEAALRAVRMGRQAVNQNDLLVSFEVVIAGTEKKGTVLTEKEKKLIAYHEVGHALVAARQKGTEPVSKITIVPHTQGALGYTMQLPEEEKFLMDKEELRSEIRTLLGGRSAEEVVFHTATTGASNDIERATDLARKMITMYGMGEKYGIMGLATVQSQYLDQSYGLTCAQATAAEVDSEIYELLEQCHQEARQILEKNRELLDKIAAYLLEKETITGQEMMAIIEGRDPALVDNFGATPEDGGSRTLPDGGNTALPSVDTDGIEKPARRISIVSEPPQAPNGDRPEDGGRPENGDTPSDEN
ncbi:MAG: ATP-dependent zinc metalloprotease FtsH [Clostridiales bacterium]|nr:ATP-dependent zinc metalloprotease FtsH [Clostridiales bacterium]